MGTLLWIIFWIGAFISIGICFIIFLSCLQELFSGLSGGSGESKGRRRLPGDDF